MVGADQEGRVVMRHTNVSNECVCVCVLCFSEQRERIKRGEPRVREEKFMYQHRAPVYVCVRAVRVSE